MKIKFKTKGYWFLAALITFSICFQVQAGINNNGIAINMIGKVEVDGQNAYNGMEVGPSSTIKTYEKSFIEVVFNEKDIFKIFENSEAVLDLDSQEKSINLKSGAISNLIKKLDALRDKFRPRYTVATAIAVAGVRGTAFFVKVEDNKNTYICVCNGEIEMKNSSDSNKTIIEEKHHKAVRFTRDEEKTFLSLAAMLYHNDEGIERLASTIDEKINWDKIGTNEK